MKVSLSWLKEYIPMDLDPQTIAQQLTMAGLEVESVESRFDYLDRVVVGRVKSAVKHPNADKLTCCTVDAGQGEDLHIVCGAPNVREGMTVACALVGATLPGDFVIRKNKIRGEVSCGMLCSGTELKLGSDASGILDLRNDLTPGTPLVQALNISDSVFEIDLTPNRPDCLSAIGVAREIAAFPQVKGMLTLPAFELPKEKIDTSLSIHDLAAVDIIDPELCPRYSAGMLVNIKVGPSPLWLKEKLESAGLTPRNNVVDITNFVMLETGQPLHAFDFDNVSQGRIEVRQAGGSIEFVTLDSKKHTLEPEMLMICDGQRPVAIAGVMGGENSEISDTTTRVLVESAYFNPVSIRRTAKRTGIATDASHRFERGIDPEGTVRALVRAMSLMADLCEATIVDGLIDEYPVRHKTVEIDLDTRALNIRLGTELTVEAIRLILESVAFDVRPGKDDHHLMVKVPSFRVDVLRPEDLSEEVARLWGYNNIRTSYPPIPAKGRPLDPRVRFRSLLRRIMTGFGFSEVITYNFIASDACDRLDLAPDDPKRSVQTILNPISEDMSVLRTSLIPGLLETMRRNTSNQTDTMSLFETGRVFMAKSTSEQPQETEMLSGLMTGSRMAQSWYAQKEGFDFFDIKGVCEALAARLNIKGISFCRASQKDTPYFENGYAAAILKEDQVLGWLGKINPRVLKNYGLRQDCFVFDLNVGALMAHRPDSISAQLLPKFPSISQDITLIVDKPVTAGSILSEIQKLGEKEPLVEKYFLFDAYEGAPLVQGKKSLSFRIIYRSEETTLKEKKVQGLHARLSESLVTTFNAGLPE